MSPRWRLFAKYAAFIIALVTAALLASGVTSLYFSWRESQEHLVALQREKASAAATRIEQYIAGIEHQLGWTALPWISAGGDAIEQRRYEYLKLLRQVPAITEVAWLDGSGREQLRESRLAMGAAGSGADFSADPKFVQTKGGGTWYSPVYFRKETEPYMTISRPAGGAGGGVTVAEVNLKFVWEVVSRIQIGKAGLAYVVNSAGTLIAHPDISLVLQKTDLSKLPQVAALAAADGGNEPIARNIKGEEVLTSHARMPTLGWTVFVEVPVAEAFAPLHASILRTGLLLLAGLVLSMLASVYLARLMVNPIRALQRGAAQIGAGQLDQRIEVHTGDELEELSGQFNRMAAELKAFYAGLERKVEERTRELTQALDRQTVISEILRVISASPTDTRPVFEAIARSGLNLFGGQDVALRLLKDDRLELTASTYPSDAAGAASLPLDGRSGTSRAVLRREVVQIPDVLAEEWVGETVREQARRRGYRATLCAPMMREDRVIGTIAINRVAPGPYTEKEVALLETFADQAVIAIENVRLFNEIQDKSRQLEAANQHKSDFLASMSHELRTPLNAIIGFSEVLIERMFGELNPKQEEYLKDIHSSGQHLLSLINDILDLSKVEAGRMELEPSVFHLPSALQNTLALVRQRAQNHGIALKLTVDPAVGEIRADERKVKQIMLNLLSNAVKFTPDGGQVSVDAHLNAEVVEVAVADTGTGIAPEDQEVVFEEFRQVGRDYTRKHEGTGLGLALTRRFVELHGGTIGLRSEVGKGSTFTFTLPLASREL
ncbi:MAG: GAF domain-containing protein [Burkholderiales bacterium]|nr:GAF domain-containing protein [Burkholderiales bacterium]